MAIANFHRSGSGLEARFDLNPLTVLQLLQGDWTAPDGLDTSPEILFVGSLPLLDSSELEMSRVSDHLAGDCSRTRDWPPPACEDDP